MRIRRLVADALKGVRPAAGDEDERPDRPNLEVAAELEAHLALEHVQRLVLVRVCVCTGGPSPGATTVSKAVKVPSVCSPRALNTSSPPKGWSTVPPSPGRWNTGSAMPPPPIVATSCANHARER
jgi:hypothetical protein